MRHRAARGVFGAQTSHQKSAQRIVGLSGAKAGGGGSFPSPSVVWLMNEGSGTVFNDTGSTANTETLQAGTLTWGSNAGIPGSSATFSATAYTTGANQIATNFDGTTPFSVSVWVRFIGSGASFHALVGTFDPASSFKGWELGTNTAPALGLVFALNSVINTNAIQVFTSSGLSTGTLYHVVATYDGSKTSAGVKIYVNGVAQATGTTVNNLTGSIANTKTVALGGRGDGSIPLNGVMADTRIYPTILSQANIAALFASGPR